MRSKTRRLSVSRIRVVVLGVVVGLLVGGGIAQADFTFGKPEPVEAVRKLSQDSFKGMCFSHDGLRLYFSANPAGGYGRLDIWIIERESPDAPWGEAVNLGPNVNSADREGWVGISSDELEIYFHRNDVSMRSIRASKDDPWGPATEFTELGDAWALDFAHDGLTVYLDAVRSDGYGASDIWMATRETLDAPWGEPVNLGPSVNDSGDQYDPSISSDGLALFSQKGSRAYLCLRTTTESDWGQAVPLNTALNVSYWTIFPDISPDGSTLYLHHPGGPSQVSIKPIVDFNGDKIINLVDLAMLIDNWRTNRTPCDIGPGVP